MIHVSCMYIHIIPLLPQDAFQLSEPPGATRSLFTRAKERHVFLFEKVIIFSKKFEAPAQKKAKKSDNYLYKGHLSVKTQYSIACSRLLRLKFKSCLAGRVSSKRSGGWATSSVFLDSPWTAQRFQIPSK